MWPILKPFIFLTVRYVFELISFEFREGLLQGIFLVADSLQLLESLLK